jgi:predicted MFS family arabinose efflux permease
MKMFVARTRAAPDGLPAAALLAFLATAGFFYVNIMPALVEGLKTGLHFSDRAAGLAGSANVYGAAAGALVATFLVTRWPWRPAALALLGVLIAVDLGSLLVSTPEVMIAVRALHGLAGGCLVGFAFSVIARTRQPERTFGMLLVVQQGMGGLGVMLLPQLVPLFGTKALFLALVLFSVLTLLLVPFLADYPRKDGHAARGPHGMHGAPPVATGTDWTLLAFALGAVFLFQFSNMLLFAYIIGLARHFALDPLHASTVVGLSAWLGVGGSLLVIAFGTRFGRVRTLVVSLLLTAAGMWMLQGSASALIYAVANCATSVTWAFVIPHLLAMCAKCDQTGRASALGGFASKMGLATGPLVGALLLGPGRYELLINIAALATLACLLVALLPAGRLDRLYPELPRPADGKATGP